MGNNKDIFFDINLINDVIDGLVDDVTAAEFFEHIKTCDNCRKTYEEALKIREIMNQNGFIPGTKNMPSADFVNKTMNKIRNAKKPLILRIISHPAAKASVAAVAVLLVAIFVFRSDLFGRIDGANGLAGEMIESGRRTDMTEEAPETSQAYIEDNKIMSYGDDSDNKLNEIFDALNENAAPETAMAPGMPSDDGSFQDYSDTDSSEAESASNIATTTTEGYMPELPSSAKEQPAMEEGSYPAASSGYSGVYEESEMPVCEEAVIEDIQETAAEPEDEPIITESAAEESEDSADPEAMPSVKLFSSSESGAAPAPMPAAYEITATIEDSQTALAVAQEIAKEQLENYKYTKIILVFSDKNEAQSVDKSKYSFIGSCKYNGNDYYGYECTVNDIDYVAEEFGDHAAEVLPPVVTEYEEKELFLVLFRTEE
ncbi:MAG: hypothetical protein II149_03310 [Clostridia bacterium]|nr:hypothetical protein [Clostridia bacterium]